MHRKGAILLPVLIVLVVISMALAAGIFYLYQKEYAQNIKLQGQIAELETRQKLTASQLEESKKTATDLELKLQEAKSRMDSLAGELAAEKSAHSDTSNKLEQLKNDLANQKSQREELENRLSQVQDDSKQIKEQIKIMQQQKAALEEKIKNLEEGAANVELGKVVVSPEDALPSADAELNQFKKTDEKTAVAEPKVAPAVKKAPLLLANGIEGKVMIVNKEFNFVVINLGSKDKVKIGDVFSVSRAGKLLGDIKIEKVHEFMSAAGFAAEMKDLIKENDKVTQRTK
ncbi:MAG TPA: hypothetical protein PL125_06325 [Candidatus Omnitrophota bacterium]|nr:hypothetical protein [Candidatus Omnitrophota bacterium]HPT39789.1 hypothetical protein [Candidatus Omnitrophota bacterium]